MQRLQEIIRYNGGVATRGEAAEGLLNAGVPFAWVVRYLSDAVAMTLRDAAKLSPRFAKFARRHERTEAVCFAAGVKPAHEHSRQEFAAALPGRVVREPSLSLSEWATQKGRSADTEFADRSTSVAELFGDLLAGPARDGRGKARVLVGYLSRYNAAQADYERAVSSGVVPMSERVVPLDPDSVSDQAYVRALHKRLVHKALGAGLTVPTHVMSEYPGLFATAGPPSSVPPTRG